MYTKFGLILSIHSQDIEIETRTSRKWSATEAVKQAENTLKHKDIVGVTAVGRQGIGATNTVLWSRSDQKETLSKNQNLTSIKGRNPFANLRKTMIYITNVDLVNDNEYTKFSLILSIRSQVIE